MVGAYNWVKPKGHISQYITANDDFRLSVDYHGNLRICIINYGVCVGSVAVAQTKMFHADLKKETWHKVVHGGTGATMLGVLGSTALCHVTKKNNRIPVGKKIKFACTPVEWIFTHDEWKKYNPLRGKKTGAFAPIPWELLAK